MKNRLVSLVVALFVPAVLADVTGSFEGVSFLATDGGKKFEALGGTGVLKNEKGEVVAEGALKTEGGVLILRAKKGSAFAHRAATAPFAEDAFPKDPPRVFAEIEVTESTSWLIKDANFVFVLEIPALNVPRIEVQLDKSLARAAVISLPKGNHTLWGYTVKVGEGGGTIKFQHGAIVEGKNAEVEKPKRPEQDTGAKITEIKNPASAVKDFLDKNAKAEGVKVLPSGLQYKVVKQGTGTSPRETDTVKVNYRGTLADGTEFDSSEKNGGSAQFPVNGVIKGWTEALQLMKEGAKWQLFIPAELAYGDKAIGPIPAGSTLIFDIELLQVVKTP